MQETGYRFNGFELDLATRELSRGGRPTTLHPRVFDCLRHLIRHRERAVEREELIAAVWRRSNVSDIQLGQLILRVRRAVGDEGHRQHSIRTVVGFGYRWIAETEVVHAPAPNAGGVPDVGARVPAAHTARPRGRALRYAAAAAVLLGLCAAALPFVAHERAAALPAAPAGSAQAVVLPLAIAGAQDAAWARLGGMDLIADRLKRSGVVVPPSETVLRVIDSARPQRRADDAGALRRATGARLIVRGAVARDGARWRVALEADAPAQVRLDADATDAELIPALRGAADRLILALGRVPPRDAAAPAGVDEIVQRARAALLAEDPGLAARILDAAPAAIRARPLLRCYRAEADVRAGRFEAAEAAFTTLLGELGAGAEPALRMRVLAGRGLARVRIGRLEDARRDFADAVATPQADAMPQELGEALRGLGIAHALLRQYADALADFGRARTEAERAADALGAARVDTDLGLLQHERGNTAEAAVYLRRAADQFETFGAVRDLIGALSGLQNAELAQLQTSAAAATSERIETLAGRAADPVQQRALKLRRAALLAAAGRYRDARALLDEIAAQPGAHLAETRDFERLHLLSAEVALGQGRVADAARDAAPLPTAPPAAGDDDLRARAALIRERALHAAQPERAAADDAPPADAPAGSAAPVPLRALANAEAALHRGRAADAERWYAAALAGAEAGGPPAEIAAVVESYASALIDRGRLTEASALVGRIAAWSDDDFGCALARLRLAHALGESAAWHSALAQVERLANERDVPPELRTPPPALAGLR